MTDVKPDILRHASARRKAQVAHRQLRLIVAWQPEQRFLVTID